MQLRRRSKHVYSDSHCYEATDVGTREVGAKVNFRPPAPASSERMSPPRPGSSSNCSPAEGSGWVGLCLGLDLSLLPDLAGWLLLPRTRDYLITLYCRILPHSTRRTLLLDLISCSAEDAVGQISCWTPFITNHLRRSGPRKAIPYHSEHTDHEVFLWIAYLVCIDTAGSDRHIRATRRGLDEIRATAANHNRLSASLSCSRSDQLRRTLGLDLQRNASSDWRTRPTWEQFPTQINALATTPPR